MNYILQNIVDIEQFTRYIKLFN